MGASATGGSMRRLPICIRQVYRCTGPILAPNRQWVRDGFAERLMRKLLAGLLLWGTLSAAWAAAALPPVEMRTLSTSDPQGLIVKLRAAFDAGVYAGNPAGEREALWWMGHAAINVSDDAAVTEAVARLESLGSVGHDTLAKSYAGFLNADLRIAHGDGGGVSDALQAAALQLDSSDPARRALAKFQLCDAYSMAGQSRHSQPLCREADTAFAALHDDWNRAQALNDEGNNAYAMAQYAQAGRYYQQARALYEKVGDHSQALMVGDNLAHVMLKQGKPKQAIALSRASLADERAAGRESDALISQHDIARAMEATGQHRDAMDLIASTVDEARKAHLDGLLPDLLQEQSWMAERNGNLKLALTAARESAAVARSHWTSSLRSQQAELPARYAAREKEIRIRELERNNQIKNLKLQAAEADAERNVMQMRRQRTTLVAALAAAIGLVMGGGVTVAAVALAAAAHAGVAAPGAGRSADRRGKPARLFPTRRETARQARRRQAAAARAAAVRFRLLQAHQRSLRPPVRRHRAECFAAAPARGGRQARSARPAGRRGIHRVVSPRRRRRRASARRGHACRDRRTRIPECAR